MMEAPQTAASAGARESAAATHTLEARGLVKAFGGRRVVDDVTMVVHSGDVVGLLGPNGAGKTTSFYMIVGLLTPDEGDVILDGDNVSTLPMYLRARRGVSYLPQEASIFRKLSVENNLRVILEGNNLGSRETSERIDTLLDEFGLTKLRMEKAVTLSGGERRRLEIARALAIEPRFILLDEPFAGIDPLAVLDIQELIRALAERGLGVLLTDHNARETLKICSRGYLLSDGRIQVEGTNQEIASSPVARRFYLGEDFTL